MVDNKENAMGQGNDKHCCVSHCTRNGRLNPNLSFHRILADQELRNKWILAIRRDPGPLFNAVCSQHFKSEDFKWTPVRKTLKPGSVPSVFTWKGEVRPFQVFSMFSFRGRIGFQM
ncbi:THAP domain-containing protein 6-like [Magallana gigas]|uniref:THAP domain-containing protein 6-like n=1 Tax=Magallana gigas TaxID=29159 RepID=UPI003341F968